jgi:gliding motility-associated-like protein
MLYALTQQTTNNLKQTLHILLVLTLTAVLGSPARAQDTDELPWACAGSEELYWVKGFNGVSSFEWRVFFNQGETRTDVTAELLDYHNIAGDTVKITWPSNPDQGGVYTFTVVETTAYGCIGTEIEQVVIVNSSTIITESFFDSAFIGQFFACDGDTVTIDPGASFYSHLWEDGSTGETLLTTEAGTFQVQLRKDFFNDQDMLLQFCSFGTAEAVIHPLPEIDLGADTTLFGTQTLTLDAWGSNFMNWEWFTYNYQDRKWNDVAEWFQSTYPVEAGAGDQWISVYVTDENGCVNSDSIRVRAADYSKFRIPSAFIPGSHIAENQRWYFPAPQEDGAEALYPYLNDIDVKVFNRWGKMVYESTGSYEPWDGRDLNGRPLPMDSYHYIIRIKISGKIYNYKGSVTIIR